MKMKFKELKDMNPEEREKKLDEINLELMKLNAQVATGTAVKSPGQLKQLKKTKAKILAIKKQNE